MNPFLSFFPFSLSLSSAFQNLTIVTILFGVRTISHPFVNPYVVIDVSLGRRLVSDDSWACIDLLALEGAIDHEVSLPITSKMAEPANIYIS